MRKKIFVLGGDLRLSYAAAALKENGFSVVCSGGIENAPLSNEEITEEIKKTEILLLGVPMTTDGINLNAPFLQAPIAIKRIAELLKEDRLLIAGGVPENTFSCKTADYLHRDDFAYFNAVPTAEGALEIAMRETNITVSGSSCLIVGYGRIGKILCRMFNGIGAKVTASARKACDIALIEAMGYKSIHTDEIENKADEYDIVINTVPYMVIDERVLHRLRTDALIIDTASKPGGVDMKTASRLGINVIWSLSLPGKVAPKTAGEIICNTSMNILNELRG